MESLVTGAGHDPDRGTGAGAPPRRPYPNFRGRPNSVYLAAVFGVLAGIGAFMG